MMEHIGFPEEFVDIAHLDEMYNHVSKHMQNLVLTLEPHA